MRLAVTTWNLQGSAGVDIAAVAGHLRDRGSDIVALQEVQRRQARRLAEVLAARSLDWRFKHWTPPARAEGMAVLGVTRPVARVAAWALTARWRPWSWRRRIVQVARLGGLGLVNVHLTPHGDAPARQREVETILDRLGIAPAGPRWIVAGDLNTTPGGAVGERLAAAGLRDAWAVAGSGDHGVTGATNWFSLSRAGPPDQRIDQVWVTGGMAVTGADLPTFGDPGFDRFPHLSDHLPLTVVLEI